MTNMDRLRKLAGLKPKQILNESDRGMGVHSFADPDSSDFALGRRDTPVVKKNVGSKVSGRVQFGPYAGQTLTGTIVRLFPIDFAEIKWDNGYTSNAHIKELSLVESVVESSTEYDIGKPTDVYGQFKAKTPEPDFPVDMGEVFSKGSSDSEGETLASMDGDAEGTSAGKVEQPKLASIEPKKTAPVASDSQAPKFAPKAKAEPKEETDDEDSEASDDSADDAPDHADDDFDKRQVKEARQFYNLKRLVRSHISENITDYGAAFMAGMKAFDALSNKLIIEHNINLTSHEEHKIAKAVAVECAEGKSTLESISESHDVEGRKQGRDYVFEFTDKAMAMIFINEVNDSGNCIGRLRYNRGFVEAVVRDFTKAK